jgi:hypothetical protein
MFLIGYIMKQKLLQLFYNYSYITNENIFKNILNKVDEKSLCNIKNTDDLQSLFFKLNEKVEMKDVLSQLFLLESNINIIDSSLSSKDDGYSNDLQHLNQQNQRLVKEIFVMLDSREFKRC